MTDTHTHQTHVNPKLDTDPPTCIICHEVAPELVGCANCGKPQREDDMVLVNVEPAHYGMDDPYPGYAGDLYCRECVGDDDV